MTGSNAHIVILYADDWVALYKNGKKVEENHSIPIGLGLEALGIDFETREVQPEGCPADDLGPADPDFWTGSEFPEEL